MQLRPGPRRGPRTKDRKAARGRLIRPELAAVTSVLVLLAVVTGHAGAQQSQGNSEHEARARGMHIFQLEYGPISSTYAAASASLGEWGESEPNNTSGLSITSENSASPVYAVFFGGNFQVERRFADVGTVNSNYAFGRIVLDRSGRVLSVLLWEQRKDASTPFGPSFDDH